jgi:nitrate reductase NapAB chaperone NapD
MPICSYLVVPTRGRMGAVAKRLAGIPGCDVVAARNREVLLLVTESADAAEERELRARVEAEEGVLALVFTFGEIAAGAVGGEG